LPKVETCLFISYYVLKLLNSHSYLACKTDVDMYGKTDTCLTVL